MNKSRYIQIIIFVGIVIFLFVCVILPSLRQYITHGKQDELANFLGVKINDYQYPNSFPIGYFDSVLKPGMTYKEVHEIVRGYDSVFHCEGDFNYEVYNYFSENKYSWIVMLISYDAEKKYEGHMETSSDSNSRTLGGRACVEGPLK